MEELLAMTIFDNLKKKKKHYYKNPRNYEKLNSKICANFTHF